VDSPLPADLAAVMGESVEPEGEPPA
jgi:hypothetical protein